MTDTSVESLLSECASEMGIPKDKVIKQVLCSADGSIDYRTRLNETGVKCWLQAALNRARTRNQRAPSRSALPFNFYSGEW